MQDVFQFDGKSRSVRAVLLAVVVVVAATAFFAVRWQFGNMLASMTRTVDEHASEKAKTAIAWSPSDPSAHVLVAATEGGAVARQHLQDAIAIAPNDHRWRIAYARFLEQDEQFDLAEAEFRQAVALAPSYARPRWHLGNFLLRRERETEALAELKLAAADDFDFRNQVFSLAWEYFEKDAGKLAEIAGEKPDAVVRLAYFLASRGRAEAAWETWNRLSGETREAASAIRQEIVDGLFLQRHFRVALEFAKEAGTDRDAAVGAITNGSFEKHLSEDDGGRFGWSVGGGDSKLQAAPDSRVRHEGERSLRLNFRNFTKPDFSQIVQTIAVEPSGRYRMTFWLRTENLRSAGPPLVEVLDAENGGLLVRSRPFAEPNAEWESVTIEFAAPANCDGITIRTNRVACGVDCPITGTLWYDDFSLTKL